MSVDWKKIVRTVAPTLGTALGTPAVGLAVKFLADNLLGDSNASEEDVMKRLMGSSPDDLLKLKELDNTFELELQRLNIDVFKLEIEDKASARDLFKINQIPQMALSTLFVSGFFIVLWFVTMGKITADPAVRDILMLLIGLLVRELSTIMQFWFGSSQGSKTKSESLISSIKDTQN